MTIPPTVEEAMRIVSAIDLSGLMARLALPATGAGWTDEEALLAEREYRRFLALHLLHPGVPLTPSKLVDQVWHAHILDTRNYERDMRTVLGRFLHHDAHTAGPAPSPEAEAAAWERTRQLYRAAFET